MLARLDSARGNVMARWDALHPLDRDGLLYALAAAFALVLGVTSTQGAQWQWGYLAMGPYAAAAILAFVFAKRLLKREHLARIALLIVVLFGAVFVPLGLEAHWRQAQPEVGVISRAGQLLSKGIDPYRTYDSHGHLINEIKGLPAFESWFT
jgi:hypothetical protein